MTKYAPTPEGRAAAAADMAATGTTMGRRPTGPKGPMVQPGVRGGPRSQPIYNRRKSGTPVYGAGPRGPRGYGPNDGGPRPVGPRTPGPKGPMVQPGVTSVPSRQIPPELSRPIPAEQQAQLAQAVAKNQARYQANLAAGTVPTTYTLNAGDPAPRLLTEAPISQQAATQSGIGTPFSKPSSFKKGGAVKSKAMRGGGLARKGVGMALAKGGLARRAGGCAKRGVGRGKIM